MAQNPRIKPIEQATGKSWEQWLKFMHNINAKDSNHHQIATKVLEQLMGKIDNPGWWAQSITTAYEQYSGKRLPGQRPDGTFQTSVSKATRLAMQPLMNTWTAFAAQDKEILAEVVAPVKISGTQNRLSWRTKLKDGIDLTIISEPKSNNTASIVVQHMGSPTPELNDEAKQKWAAIIGRFMDSLASVE